MEPRFCVIGAGHGGLAMAGWLSLAGFPVNLYNRSPERIEPVNTRGGVQLGGVLRGFGTIDRATTDPGEALLGCDIVMVVVPATAHQDLAQVCAPHLTDDQLVVLNPGRTFGALEFERVLRTCNCAANVVVAEAQALLLRSRITGPGQVRIIGIRNAVPLASLRAHLIPRVLGALRPAFPQFVAGDSVLSTSLNSIGPALHPAQMILNAARIEESADFELYSEGTSPSVCRVLEDVDAERVAVAETIGIRGITARQWLYMAHNVSGRSLYEAVRSDPSYRNVPAPRRLSHRYITEDVPTCLVPIASIGRELGCPAPTIESIVNLASAMAGTDFWAIGRTVEGLGLKGLSVRDLRLLALGSAALAEPAQPGPDAAMSSSPSGGSHGC